MGVGLVLQLPVFSTSKCMAILDHIYKHLECNRTISRIKLEFNSDLLIIQIHYKCTCNTSTTKFHFDPVSIIVLCDRNVTLLSNVSVVSSQTVMAVYMVTIIQVGDQSIVFSMCKYQLFNTHTKFMHMKFKQMFISVMMDLAYVSVLFTTGHISGHPDSECKHSDMLVMS